MPVPDELIEAMTRAAVNDAFQQKGMSRDSRLQFDAAGQSYSFMGVDLKQCIAAAAAAIEENGWTISRVSENGRAPAAAESSGP